MGARRDDRAILGHDRIVLGTDVVEVLLAEDEKQLFLDGACMITLLPLLIASCRAVAYWLS